MPDMHDRFRSLDRMATPDQWTEIVDRAAQSPAPATRPSPGLLVAATLAVLVVAVGVGLAAGGFIGQPAPGSGSPTPSADGLTASVTDGDFRLTITTPKANWSADEAIEVQATLEYLGSASEVTLFGSGGGPLGFAIDEVNGDRDMGPAFTSDCAPHTITPDAPITTPFVKSGGYSPDDPNADFWDAYFADPLLHLPAGQWRITASATFDAGETCTASPTAMEVSLDLTVEPSTAPSSAPSPSDAPSPSVEASPTGPEPPFTCGLTITSAPDSNDIRHLTDVRVGTHEGYDRVTFEFAEAGIPGFELRRVDPPFTQDPSDLPIEVAGSPVYQIVITGANHVDADGNLTYDGPTDFRPSGFPQIAQLVEAGDFEAVNTWYLGVNGSTCLRAFHLTDPSRIVIDIQH